MRWNFRHFLLMDFHELRKALSLFLWLGTRGMQTSDNHTRTLILLFNNIIRKVIKLWRISSLNIFLFNIHNFGFHWRQTFKLLLIKISWFRMMTYSFILSTYNFITFLRSSPLLKFSLNSIIKWLRCYKNLSIRLIYLCLLSVDNVSTMHFWLIRCYFICTFGWLFDFF